MYSPKFLSYNLAQYQLFSMRNDSDDNIHNECLIEACRELKLPYEFISENKAFIAVTIEGNKHYFIANDTPFNSAMTRRICQDKGYTYELLNNTINMPKTEQYVDPDPPAPYEAYASFRDFEPIKADILKHLSLPLILKKNSGSVGTNVFLIKEEDRIIPVLKTIFDRSSRFYDHVAIAQEYIKPHKEYRVTVLKKEIELIYEKDVSAAHFTGNLSPLHWTGAKAVIQQDNNLRNQIKTFISPLFSKLDLEYGGLDIIEDEHDKFWLIEINSQPTYSYLVDDNGKDVLVGLYKKMLKKLAH